MSASKSHPIMRALARNPAMWALSPREGAALKALLAERDEVVAELIALLLSADASWEHRDGGHDWRAACESARALLKRTSDAHATPSVADEENS